MRKTRSHFMTVRSSKFAWIVVAMVYLFVFLFILDHLEYYALSKQHRPLHELHANLRSSSSLGLTMGISAAVLFLLNLAYLLRKRWIRVRWLGPLRYWMDFHVLTGMVGAAFIVIHSSLSLTSMLGALSAISLALTVVTGVIGRAIYAEVPRALDGHELELKEVKKELEACEDRLDAAGVDFRLFDMQALKPAASNRLILVTLMYVLKGGFQRRLQYKQIETQLLALDHSTFPHHDILAVVKSYCLHYQWIARFHDIKQLISSWRFFHRWMSILMLAVMMFHIFISIRYFLWEKFV